MIEKTATGRLVWLLTVFLLVSIHLAEAQQPKKVWRIGLLSGSRLPHHEALRQGLRELGYIEGKNLLVDDRYAEGNFNRFPELAAELVRLRVDVIVTGGTQATLAAKQSTKQFRSWSGMLAIW